MHPLRGCPGPQLPLSLSSERHDEILDTFEILWRPGLTRGVGETLVRESFNKGCGLPGATLESIIITGTLRLVDDPAGSAVRVRGAQRLCCTR